MFPPIHAEKGAREKYFIFIFKWHIERLSTRWEHTFALLNSLTAQCRTSGGWGGRSDDGESLVENDKQKNISNMEFLSNIIIIVALRGRHEA